MRIAYCRLHVGVVGAYCVYKRQLVLGSGRHSAMYWTTGIHLEGALHSLLFFLLNLDTIVCCACLEILSFLLCSHSHVGELYQAKLKVAILISTSVRFY